MYQIIKDKRLRKQLRKFFVQLENTKNTTDNLLNSISYIVYVCFVKAVDIYNILKQQYPEESREIDLSDVVDKVYGLVGSYLSSIWQEEEGDNPKLKLKGEDRYIG